jgi:hypothetical protein
MSQSTGDKKPTDFAIRHYTYDATGRFVPPKYKQFPGLGEPHLPGLSSIGWRIVRCREVFLFGH